MGKRKTYSKEFKSEAVKLVRDSGKPVTQIARELGISGSALAGWAKQDDADNGRGRNGMLTTDEREEMRQLRKELRIARQERDILKKSVTFFAKECA